MIIQGLVILVGSILLVGAAWAVLSSESTNGDSKPTSASADPFADVDADDYAADKRKEEAAAQREAKKKAAAEEQYRLESEYF